MNDQTISVPQQRSLAGRSAGADAPAKRLLIVEDEKVVADNLAELLQSMGYDVVARTSSGEDAVEKVAQTQPDLILMDIYLRGKLDGIEAAQIIARDHDIPVIYLTAYSNRTIQERLRAHTPFGYVLKPFDEGELRIVIEIALFRGSTEAKLKKLNQELQDALSHIRTLTSLLPICAWCKKVRDDEGYWQQLEEYVTSHSPTQLTHGICPECSAKVLANSKKGRK